MKKIPANDISLRQEIDAKIIGNKIEMALKVLSLKQREVFILRMYEQMSFKEIARIKNVQLIHAWRMQYALNKMKEILKKDFNEL